MLGLWGHLEYIRGISQNSKAAHTRRKELKFRVLPEFVRNLLGAVSVGRAQLSQLGPSSLAPGCTRLNGALAGDSVGWELRWAQGALPSDVCQ